MNNALSLFLKLFGAKLVRHALAWLLGMLAAHNIQVDSSNVGTLLVTLAGSLALVVWSVAAKSEPSDELKEKIKDFTGALVSNSLPMLLGYLNAKGVNIDDHTDLVTAGLAVINVTKSALITPDAPSAADRSKLKLPLFALLSATALLASCKRGGETVFTFEAPPLIETRTPEQTAQRLEDENNSVRHP